MKVFPAKLVLAMSLALISCGSSAKVIATTPADTAPEGSSALAEAIAAERAGDFKRAAQHYQEAIEREPSNIDAATGYVRLLIAQRRQGEAVTIARAYSDREPAATLGFLLLAEALMADGQHERAAEVLTQLIELDEGGAEAFYQRSRALAAGDQLEAALDDARKAAALAADEPRYRIELAATLAQMKRPGEAVAELRAALELEPQNADAHRSLGRLLRGQSHLDEALSHHLKATRYGADDASNFFELGITQNLYGDNLASEQSLAHAVELAPDDALHWYAYGEILRALGRYSDAIGAYEKALELEPTHEKAPAKLGFVLYSSGDLERAEVVLTTAIRSNPQNPYPYWNLALLYEKSERWRQAAEAFAAFVERAPAGDADVAAAKRKVRQMRRRARGR